MAQSGDGNRHGVVATDQGLAGGVLGTATLRWGGVTRRKGVYLSYVVVLAGVFFLKNYAVIQLSRMLLTPFSSALDQPNDFSCDKKHFQRRTLAVHFPTMLCRPGENTG